MKALLVVVYCCIDLACEQFGINESMKQIWHLLLQSSSKSFCLWLHNSECRFKQCVWLVCVCVGGWTVAVESISKGITMSIGISQNVHNTATFDTVSMNSAKFYLFPFHRGGYHHLNCPIRCFITQICFLLLCLKTNYRHAYWCFPVICWIYWHHTSSHIIK